MKSSDKGRVYEDWLAEAYGKRQPGSGSNWTTKEDLLGEGPFSDFMLQAKNASGQKSYTLKLEDLQILRKHASTLGRTGIMFINFGENKEFVVMRRKDFDHLLGDMS